MSVMFIVFYAIVDKKKHFSSILHGLVLMHINDGLVKLTTAMFTFRFDLEFPAI